jgi:hypothetical protein
MLTPQSWLFILFSFKYVIQSPSNHVQNSIFCHSLEIDKGNTDFFYSLCFFLQIFSAILADFLLARASYMANDSPLSNRNIEKWRLVHINRGRGVYGFERKNSGINGERGIC